MWMNKSFTTRGSYTIYCMYSWASHLLKSIAAFRAIQWPEIEDYD